MAFSCLHVFPILSAADSIAFLLIHWQIIVFIHISFQPFTTSTNHSHHNDNEDNGNYGKWGDGYNLINEK